MTAGGLYLGGNTTYNSDIDLSYTSIVENVASDRGGGLFLEERSDTSIYNSTIGKNIASQGGAIYSDNEGKHLIHVSIAENSSTSKGAVTGGGSFSLVNTYIANNAGGDCNFVIETYGMNLDSDNSCGLGSSDFPGTNPEVSYDSTQHVFNANSSRSPIVDTAFSYYCYATDQKGTPTPNDGNNDGVSNCDIGSMEYKFKPSIKTPSLKQPGTKTNNQNN